MPWLRTRGVRTCPRVRIRWRTWRLLTEPGAESATSAGVPLPPLPAGREAPVSLAAEVTDASGIERVVRLSHVAAERMAGVWVKSARARAGMLAVGQVMRSASNHNPRAARRQLTYFYLFNRFCL